MLMLKRSFLKLIEQEIPVWKLLGSQNSVPECSEWKQTFWMESVAALWRRRGVHRTKAQAESNLFRKSGTSIIPFWHSGLTLVLKLFLFLHEHECFLRVRYSNPNSSGFCFLFFSRRIFLKKMTEW